MIPYLPGTNIERKHLTIDRLASLFAVQFSNQSHYAKTAKSEHMLLRRWNVRKYYPQLVGKC